MNATNVGRTPALAPSSSWIGILVALLALVVLFSIYYETIGYYVNIGWNRMRAGSAHGETISIQSANGALSATMVPANGGGILNRLETDVEVALDGGRAQAQAQAPSSIGPKQVFNIRRNVYTFEEAEPLCRAFGAELATYDQVKDAYEHGADWCNYGWSKGQLALYPTQAATYDRLQQGPEESRMSCGVPGVNGGYFPNSNERFGVNCFGPRPPETALDRREESEDGGNTAFDREVNHFRAERDSIAVNPWSAAAKRWAE